MINVDWSILDLRSVNIDRELTMSAQNIVTLTERLVAVEQSLDPDSPSGAVIPRAEDLRRVLQSELDKEYEFRDLYEKIRAMKELGVE